MIWARWFPPEPSNYAGGIRPCNGPAGLGEINDEELDRLDEEVRKEEKNILSGLSDATMDAIESVDWGELGRDTGKVLVSTLQMTLDTALAASSIGLILLGLTGSALGGAVTCTGVGAAVGVPAAAVSVTAVAAGVSGLAISVSKTAGDCVKFSENLGDMAGKSYTKPKSNTLTDAQKSRLKALDNVIEHNLKESDFSGTLRDLQGNPVPNPQGGYYDHLTEMKQSYTALNKIKVGLEGSLQNPKLSSVDKKILQNGLDKSKFYIQRIEKLFEPFGGIK